MGIDKNKIKEWYKIVYTSGLFDEEYYFLSFPDLLQTDIDPLWHYLEKGALEGRNPSAWFDSEWYLQNYPEVKEAFINPLVHYIVEGKDAGYTPKAKKITEKRGRAWTKEEKEWYQIIEQSGRFDLDFYIKKYEEVKESGKYPLAHYIEVGSYQGYWPAIWFDPEWYLQHYQEVKERGINPFVHYLTEGRQKEYLPREPLAGRAWNEEEKECYSILYGTEAFDKAYYLETYLDVEQSGKDPLAHFIEVGIGERRKPNQWFDAVFYFEVNPEIEEALNRGELHTFATYLKELDEVRRGSKKFDEALIPFDENLYLELLPHVKTEIENGLYASAFEHFYKIGYDELRKGTLKWPTAKSFCNTIDKRRQKIENYTLYSTSYDGTVPLSEYYQAFELNDIQNGYRLFHEAYSPYNRDFYREMFADEIGSMDPFEHFQSIGCQEIIEGNRVWEKREMVVSNERPLLFSIIMPTWNRKETIDIAIESVLKQTYPHWELLITDDQSSDGTVEYLYKRYHSLIEEGKIKIFVNQEKGVCSARNTSLMAAEGDIIAYLDSDNFWERNYLEELEKVYRSNDSVETVYTAIRVIDKNRQEEYVRAVSYSRMELLSQNYIDMNIFSHRAELVTLYGAFNTTMNRLVDYELIVRYTRENPPYFIDKVLASYIFDKGNNQISDVDSYEINTNIFKELNKLEMKALGLSPKNSYLTTEEKVLLNSEKNATLPWNSVPDRVAGRVSIIIPVYNNLDLTVKCLDSILNKTLYDNYEVIIVDNYSTDGTAKFFDENKHLFSEKVKYISNNFNYGYSVGNNIGFFHATGEYILLLNNDMEVVTYGWLNRFIDGLEAEKIGIVGPKLLYPDETIQCAGIAFNNINCMPYHIFQHSKRDDVVVNKERLLNATTGACMFMKADMYQQVGGLSPEYLNGGEDVDLCFKVQEAFDTKVKYIPTVELIHHESKSEGRSIAIEYNREVLYEKWLKRLQPRDDMLIYAQEGMIVDEYKRNPHDKKNQTAIYLPRFMPKLPYFLQNDENKKKVKSIIIFKPSGIGNMIMFTPALSAIKEMYSNAKLTVACYGADAKIVEDFVDEVMILHKDPKTGAFDPSELENRIKEGEYEIAVYPQFTNFGTPTPFLKSVIPYHIFFKPVDYTVKHEVLHNMDIAYKLGWKKGVPSMWTPVERTFEVSEELKGSIVVHVGASDTVHMQKKKWPEEQWVELINTLPKDEKIIFVGGANETESIDKVVASIEGRVITRYDGQLNLKQTAKVIESGKMMISTDSGLMHMAAALKKPLVAIFGPTLLSKNSAWGEGFKKIHVQSPTECAPCYADPKKLFECPDAVCMREITVASILDAVMEIVKDEQ